MADFTDNEEISAEEKLQIAQHFLLSSPPGQFNEILEDVRKIIQPDTLSDALAGGIARVANIKNNKVIKAPSGKQVLLHQAGEIDPVHYFDSVSGNVFTVDHLTLATEEASDVPNGQDESLEMKRSAIQEKLNKYVTSSFRSELSAGGVFAKDGKISIGITGEKVNLKNFWSGRWQSTWTVTFAGDSATISGDIKLHIHYFEDGNLQLHGNKAVPESSAINFVNEGDLADKVIQFITSHEQVLQSGMEEMYTTMNNETLRAMRRTMPITRTKMEWNVNAVRMVKQVRK